MKYYILDRFHRTGDVYLERSNVPKNIEDNYSSGNSLISNKSPEFFYKYKTHRKVDYLSSVEGYPIVSEKMKSAFIKHSISNVEFLPVEIICEKTGETDSSYSLLNILDNVSCFDYEKSQYSTMSKYKDIIVGVSSLVIHYGKLDNRDIARIRELPVLILISEKLRLIFEEEEISGVVYQNIEDCKLG